MLKHFSNCVHCVVPNVAGLFARDTDFVQVLLNAVCEEFCIFCSLFSESPARLSASPSRNFCFVATNPDVQIVVFFRGC